MAIGCGLKVYRLVAGWSPISPNLDLSGVQVGYLPHFPTLSITCLFLRSAKEHDTNALLPTSESA